MSELPQKTQAQISAKDRYDAKIRVERLVSMIDRWFVTNNKGSLENLIRQIDNPSDEASFTPAIISSAIEIANKEADSGKKEIALFILTGQKPNITLSSNEVSMIEELSEFRMNLEAAKAAEKAKAAAAAKAVESAGVSPSEGPGVAGHHSAQVLGKKGGSQGIYGRK